MKLNANILYERLEELFTVEMFGPKTDKLALLRPELYMDDNLELLSDHLYLATADRLSAHPRIQKNAVLVCIGTSTFLSQYKERCCVIVIKEKREFYHVYQALHSIFDFYDAWNDRLFDLFKNDSELQELLKSSQGIFPDSIIVIDSSFHFLAAVHGSDSNMFDRWGFSENALDQNSVGSYLSDSELLMDVHEPIVFDKHGITTLCVNLFDSNEIYTGCLCIDYLSRKWCPGDSDLAVYLARIIERTIEKRPALLTNERSVMRQILRDLVNESPISPKQRLKLKATNMTTTYVCVVFHSLSRTLQLPGNYICNLLENSFPNSLSFQRENDIVGFIDLKHLGYSEGSWEKELTERLVPILKSMKFCAGISNDFIDLYDAKICIKQAESAIDNGVIADFGQSCYFFSDYALMEMILNSLGEFSVEAYFPNGLKQLLKHDETSSVNYFQTLKVVLSENMNYSKAASILYVHRSTLIDRMERIERDLKLDLSNSDQRLLLQILLKAIDINALIKETSN
jgi:hypothetical protein